jgi:hypothetical protein
MTSASSAWWCAAALALMALWVPTIGVFCADYAAERWFAIKPWPMDAFLAAPLWLAPMVGAAYLTLAVSQGLKKCKTVWGKTLIALLGVGFGAVNLGLWVLANLWFYLDVMQRDSL